MNDRKTGVMCISSATSFKACIKLTGRHGEILGSDSLKCLGVTINSDCSFRTHSKNIAAKLRSKTWALTKLKRLGLGESDLKRVYTSVIRPTAEYAAVAWHSLLTEEQSMLLERQQNQALKTSWELG